LKYRCTKCGRVYPQRTQAIECCSQVEAVADDQVTLCPVDGDACNAPGCVHCKGTGLMLKNGEKK
jgi:hypothetical protein